MPLRETYIEALYPQHADLVRILLLNAASPIRHCATLSLSLPAMQRKTHDTQSRDKMIQRFYEQEQETPAVVLKRTAAAAAVDTKRQRHIKTNKQPSPTHMELVQLKMIKVEN